MARTAPRRNKALSKRWVVPEPTTIVRLLPCPALERYDPTGATEEVDAFLARTRGMQSALAVHTLADVAQETDPEMARIGMTRVAAAMGLAKIAGALIDRVELQQHTTLLMRDKSDAELEVFMKQADVVKIS